MSDFIKTFQGTVFSPSQRPPVYVQFSRNISPRNISTPIQTSLVNCGQIHLPHHRSLSSKWPVGFLSTVSSDFLSCSEPHVSTDSGIDSSVSKQVFTDALHSTAEIEVESQVKHHDNTKCANCDVLFPRRKKPNVGFVRFSFSYLNVSNATLQSKGDFVCSECRKFFTTKKPRAKTAPSNPIPVPMDCITDAITLQSGYSSEISEQVEVCDAVPDHNYCASTFSSVKQSPSKCHRNRKRVYSTPIHRTPKRTNNVDAQTHHTEQPANSRVAFKQTCIDLIRQSKYEQALNLMYKSPNRFVRNAFLRFLEKVVKKEVTKFTTGPSSTVFQKGFNHDNLKSFDWKLALSEAKQAMPMSLAAIMNFFPSAKRTSKLSMVGKKGQKR